MVHCIGIHYLFLCHHHYHHKHLSLPEWSMGLLALPLLFLTVLSRATVIVKLKVLDTAEVQDFALPPRKVCGTILKFLCVSFFFLQIYRVIFSCMAKYMFAIFSAVHEELKKSPCMKVEVPARGKNLTQSNQTSPSVALSYQVQSALASHFDISPHMQLIKPKVR